MILRLLAAKKIELELKALDENRFDRTIEELCREASPNDLWLKCTHGNLNAFFIIDINRFFLVLSVILRTAMELKTLLTPLMSANDSEFNYRPRIGR